jgi:PEP-CTERM motif
MKHRQFSLVALGAALVLGGATAAQATQVSVGVTASAIDIPDGFAFVTNSDGANPLGLPTASATAGASAGSSFSQAEANVDALAGAMHMSLSASTSNPPTGMSPGRDGFAQGSMFMSGSITLSDGLPAGDATFTAILEGLYNGGPADTGAGNIISGNYDFTVSTDNVTSGTVAGPIYFGPGEGGSFAIPMSVTLPVYGGEVVYFNMDLSSTYVEAVAGSVAFDASKTFKITGVDLPPGYTYTPDSGGFLSEFGGTEPSPVPEPATWTLSLMGLVGVVFTAARRRRGRGVMVP